MSKILPTIAEIRTQIADYTQDSRKIVETCLVAVKSSSAFQEIYQISLSTYTVLGNLAGPKLCPPLNPARSLSVRVPLLIGIGQSSVAETELRRFAELIFWTVFFSDHPVEWQNFSAKTGAGFSQDSRKPISYAAHRPLAFYLEYAVELMNPEPSGLGVKAVKGVEQAVKKLNAAVHAGHLARAQGKIPPHDDVSEKALQSFAKIQRLTFSNCILLFAAYRRSKFDRLNAVSRAYFDWLIGPKYKREIRKGPFGLE